MSDQASLSPDSGNFRTARSFQVTNLLSSLPTQFLQSQSSTGFNLNILIIGDKEIGKSTILKCLFNEKILYNQRPEEDSNSTEFDISSETVALKKDGVVLNVTVHETVNYNQQVQDKVEGNVKPIVRFLEKQMYSYFSEESLLRRRTSRHWTVDQAKLNPKTNSQHQQQARYSEDQSLEELSSQSSGSHINAFKDTRVHLCIYCIPSILTPLRAIDLECIRSINHLVPVVPVVARADSLIASERTFFKKRIQDQLLASDVEVYSGSDIFFLIGSVDQYRALSWGKINVEDPNHNDFKKFRKYILEKQLLNLIDHTNQVCYESFRRKILLAAGVPEEASIYGGVNNYLSQLRQSMEDDRKRLKDKFVARIKVAESEMAQDKEAIGNQQAKDEGQINHIASRLNIAKKTLEAEEEAFRAQQEEVDAYLIKKYGSKSYASKRMQSTMSMEKIGR